MARIFLELAIAVIILQMAMAVIFLEMAMVDFSNSSHLNVVPDAAICRDRFGWFNVTLFQLWACSHCFTYLFPEHVEAVKSRSLKAEEIIKIEGSNMSFTTNLYLDMFDGDKVKDEDTCTLLGRNGCHRLASCCKAAIEGKPEAIWPQQGGCAVETGSIPDGLLERKLWEGTSRDYENCRGMLKRERCCSSQTHLNSTSYHIQDGALSCPRTWDGFACFEETPAGQVARISCPSYVGENMDIAGVGRKLCTESGAWEKKKGKEWTDYSSCVSLQGFRILYYVCITCNAISLLCLVPACVIFIKFKQLHRQHRIRIHLNLFVSFILTSCTWLSWDHLIFRDRMENPKEDAIMHKKMFQEACKVLYIISRYSWTCNCVWMSLEGFHLYRLINHAFKAPKSIFSYYFIGWLSPLVPTFVYSFVRIVKFDNGCWVSNTDILEWIMYGPILFCILLNLVFLTIILRILLTQIQTHPNEPSNYRRALKATFILVPLFGLQLFLVVYRPNENVMGSFTYEVIASIISNSQGAAVATVFCFLNSEVHSQICSHVSWPRTRHSAYDIRSFTLSTELRRPSSRDARLENIPLNCTNFCHGSHNGSIGDRRSNSSVLSLKWQQPHPDGSPVKEQMV